VYIIYYNNFADPDPPITKDSTIVFILAPLVNNSNVLALIIYFNEVTSLLFNGNRNKS
jgi:hypothetical protein